MVSSSLDLTRHRLLYTWIPPITISKTFKFRATCFPKFAWLLASSWLEPRLNRLPIANTSRLSVAQCCLLPHTVSLVLLIVWQVNIEKETKTDLEIFLGQAILLSNSLQLWTTLCQFLLSLRLSCPRPYFTAPISLEQSLEMRTASRVVTPSPVSGTTSASCNQWEMSKFRDVCDRNTARVAFNHSSDKCGLWGIAFNSWSIVLA